MTRLRAFVAAFCFLVSALLMTHVSASDDTNDQTSWSSAFSDGQGISSMQSNALSELSGLVASKANRGLFWAHNDSGNGAYAYLIDPASGVIRLRAKLKGITNTDFEDITLQSISGTSYVVIGDIGDNRAVRDNIQLYRFKEPVLSISTNTDNRQTQALEIPKSEIETMTITYAEGARDAETLLTNQEGQLVIITKREQSNFIYVSDFISNKASTLASVGRIDIKNITAGDMNRHGEIVLRNYNQIYYWPESDQPLEKTLMSVAPELPFTAPEPQGEAIAWDGNGNIYSIPEKRFIFAQVINFYQRRQ